MGGLRLVGGRWRGRRIKAPRDSRPTAERVREALMSILASSLEGARVVDLFAGGGALGLEALSRGATSATFVESNRHAARVLRENIRALRAEVECEVVVADVFHFLNKIDDVAFDLALADPPYSRSRGLDTGAAPGDAARLLQRFREAPFAQILSVEHGANELVSAPPGADQRRYGDSVLTIIAADLSHEEAT